MDDDLKITQRAGIDLARFWEGLTMSLRTKVARHMGMFARGKVVLFPLIDD